MKRCGDGAPDNLRAVGWAPRKRGHGDVLLYVNFEIV